MTLFKTLIFTILVPGTVTVLIPRWLLSTEHTTPTEAIHYLGLVPILMGAAIYLWCAWDFATFGKGTPAPIDAPKKLVVRGLYRITRNPMYVGIGLILIGEAVLFASFALLAYIIAFALLVQLFVTFYEEPTLRRQFGDAYQNYCAAVPRWILRFNNGSASWRKNRNDKT